MSTAQSLSAHPVSSSAIRLEGAILAVWLAAVVVVGARDGFVTPPGSPPLRMLAGFAVPVAVFLVALWTSRGFRAHALAADVRLMTGIQAWRFAGIAFLALYANGILSGGFAWPAGLGDIAIGLTAPFVVSAIQRDRRVVERGWFVVWNLLGILDLLVAVGAGGLGSALATGAPGEVSPRPMARLPLVLIPAYFVPIFVMSHVAALAQARRARAGR